MTSLLDIYALSWLYFLFLFFFYCELNFTRGCLFGWVCGPSNLFIQNGSQHFVLVVGFSVYFPVSVLVWMKWVLFLSQLSFFLAQSHRELSSFLSFSPGYRHFLLVLFFFFFNLGQSSSLRVRNLGKSPSSTCKVLLPVFNRC